MNRQVEIKAEQIARRIIAGERATHIAEAMGLSYGGLQRILRCQEYLDIERSVRQRINAKMDVELDAKTSLRKELEDSVPDALKVLLDNVRKKRDLRAALEVLDRDPSATLTKRTAASVERESQMRQQSLPDEMLRSTAASADATRELLVRVPQAKPAEA